MQRQEALHILIQQQVQLEQLPDDLEISELLLDEERVQTNNIVYQTGRPVGGGAFHQKKEKNRHTPEENRQKMKAKRLARKKKR